MSCPKCQEGFILPGEPTGTIEKDFNGAYYARAPDGQDSNVAVLLLTDAFGMGLKNPKILADTFAQRVGCDVWIPDYFDGKPLVPSNKLRSPDHAAQIMTTWDWICFICDMIPNIPNFIRSRPSVADARVVSFINIVKEKKNYTKLGVVGYCYGGTTAVRFSATDYIQTAVILHPGAFAKQQVEAIKVPTSWACAEVDIYWSRDKRLGCEAILAARKEQDTFTDYEFVDYKGTAHGFGCRPNLNRPEIKEAHEKAIDQTVNWFKKTLLTTESPST